MTQPTLFDAPIPVRGTTSTARAASTSGAQAVAATWPERQRLILHLLARGPKSRQELEGLTPYPINSICSVVGALLAKGAIERTGDFDVHVGGRGTITRRERFRVRQP